MSLYGKHFASMYDGSMFGKGAVGFALMGYILSKMEVQWEGIGRAKIVTNATVRLNPKLLAAIFGEPEEKVVKTIDEFCSPDPESTTKTQDGKKLIKIGEFEYQVVNGAHYQNIKSRDEQREKTAERQRKYRDKQKPSKTKSQVASEYAKGERAFVESVDKGLTDTEAMEAAEHASRG